MKSEAQNSALQVNGFNPLGFKRRFALIAFVCMAAMGAAQSETKPYDQVITADAKTQTGVVSVHSVRGRTLLEIPASALNKDFLWNVERGAVAAVAAPGLSDPLSAATTSTLMVRFVQIGDRIFVRNLTPSLNRRTGSMPIGPATLPNSDQKVPPMERAVAESSLAPTMLALPVLTRSSSGGVVLDVTDVFQQDLPELGLSTIFGRFQVDRSRSYIESTRVFPQNALIVSYITAASLVGGPSLSATVKHSITLLPEVPMQPRNSDNKVGFFTVDFEQYSEDSNDGVVNRSYVRRYRLEKKNTEASISEPVKPIVYYIGRTVPEKWRPYIMQGIEDWNVAFAEAGFKNAIIGKLAPTPAEDPDWDPGDTRHSVIRWIANPVVNAIGPNTADPRTGEILSAHILIWENVLKLTNSWYYTMCSGVDERARILPMSDEITGRMLRYAVSHEVGHSMGLRHNHRASTAYTVAQLRDPSFTAKFGSTASIMAYGRMNYVAQPEDKVAVESLMPRIGPYDKHAIRWGYTPLSKSAEEKTLTEWANKSLTDPHLSFGGEDFSAMVDPNVLTQNIGKERVEATRLGMLNLKRAMQYLVDATTKNNASYDTLYDNWMAVLDCRYSYLDSVSKEIGGREETRSSARSEPQFKPVSLQRQKAAVS